MVSLSDPQCQNPWVKAWVIAPKVTGLISLISSTFIIQHVLRDRKRRSLVYHRLLMGMSISDLFGSFVLFLSTWPIPRGEACLAAGTTATCTAQGFFDQVTVLCTPTYNVSLAIYYILVIVKGWKETRVKRIEKYLHAVPILAGFGTGFAGLGLKLYNNAGVICWIGPAPNNPERHNPNYGIYRIAFLYAEAWAMIIFLAVCMSIIYFHVLKQERKLDNYSTKFSKKKRKQSKKIRNQAFLYVGCMYITWLFGSIQRFMQFAGKKPPAAITTLFVTFFPLQGFFNLVVYMFPRIVRYFDQGVPFRSSLTFFSSISTSFRISRSRTSKSRSSGQQSSRACEEGVLQSGVNGDVLEVDDDLGLGGEEKRAGLNVDNANGDKTNANGEGEGEGESGEDWRGGREEDVIDELEGIVET